MARDGLAEIAERDFRAGMVRSAARSEIPRSGLYDILNGLLVDDGLIWRRGGSIAFAGAQLRANKPIRFAWDGDLSPMVGHRTLFADYDSGTPDGHFGTLDGSAMPVDLGRMRDASDATTPGPPAYPIRAAELGGAVFIDGGNMWAGSRKTADYAIGTVTTTNGSAVITGAGTSWLANADAGMILRVGAERAYIVQSVDSNTQITLTEPYQNTTGAGKAYKLLVLAAAPPVSHDHYAVAANRLIGAAGNKLEFSAGRDPTTGLLRWYSFNPLDFHLLPEGANTLGVIGLGGSAIWFTTQGVWVVSNLAYNLTDPAGNVQQSLEKVSDLVLWGKGGLAVWENRLIVPARDGIYLFAPGVPRVSLSLSIDSLLRQYLRSGYLPGQAGVLGGHYFLPIVNTAGAVQDFLVCRLDRAVRSAMGEVFPWSRFSGASVGAAVTPAAAGVSDRVLIGGTPNGWLIQHDPFNLASTQQDYDGSAYPFEVTTRDYDAGEAPVLFKKARVRYEATGTAPTVQAYSSDGAAETQMTTPQTDGPASDGEAPAVWNVNRRTRRLRLRIRSDSAATKLNLREIALFFRQSGKQ